MIPASKRKKRDVSLPSLTMKSEKKRRFADACLLADEKRNEEVHLPSSVVIVKSMHAWKATQGPYNFVCSGLGLI
jgi:hypothetical protein